MSENEQTTPDQAARRQPVSRNEHPVVEVKLSGPSRRAIYRRLGSVCERHGMRMRGNKLRTDDGEIILILVEVPRAPTLLAAEQVVASFLDDSSLSADATL